MMKMDNYNARDIVRPFLRVVNVMKPLMEPRSALGIRPLTAALVLAPLPVIVGEMPDSHPSIAFLFRTWTMPTLWDWVIMSGLGLVWAGGMYFMARAYSVAQASVIAPFEYVSLPINIMWGVLFWGRSQHG